MSSEILNATSSRIHEVVASFGMTTRPGEPFYRDESGQIILFRAEQEQQGRLHVSRGDEALYGPGAYGTNTPKAAAHYVYQGEPQGVGIGMYRLPEVPDELVGTRMTRLAVDRGSESLVFFPMPALSRVMIRGIYADVESGGLPPRWALVREKTGMDLIEGAKKVAWLGSRCIGTPRR